MRSPSTKIMIIEPNLQMRGMIRHLLKAGGTGNESIFEVKDFPSAIKFIETSPVIPDVILCDCGWNGQELLSVDFVAKVRSHEPRIRKKIHLILLMSLPTPGNVHQAISSGVDDILVKPFTTERLHECLKNVKCSLAIS